jgi:hypothetical protein
VSRRFQARIVWPLDLPPRRFWMWWPETTILRRFLSNSSFSLSFAGLMKMFPAFST